MKEKFSHLDQFLQYCCNETDCNFKTKSPEDFEAHLTLHNSSSTQEISQIIKECEPKFVEALKKYKANQKRVIKQEGRENISLSLNFEESQELQESQDLLAEASQNLYVENL